MAVSMFGTRKYFFCVGVCGFFVILGRLQIQVTCYTGSGDRLLIVECEQPIVVRRRPFVRAQEELEESTCFHLALNDERQQTCFP